MGSSFSVIGYYGFGNVGDDAIGYTAVNQIESIFSPDQIFVTSGGRPVFDNPSVETIPFSPVPVAKSISRSDIVVVTGGSHFHDQYPDLLTGLKVFFFYLFVVGFSKFLRKRIYLLGHGIGPLNNPIYKILTVIILYLSDFTTVRDPLSKQIVPSFISDVEITFDLGILDAISAGSSESSSTELGISVTPAFTKDENDPKRNEKLLSDISSGINSFISRRNIDNITIFVFHTGDFNADEGMSTDLKQQVNGDNTTIVQYDDDPMGFVQRLSESDIFIGMKYHSLIFSYLYHVPCAGISYHQKCESFRKYAGYRDDTTIRMENVTETEIECLLISMYDSPNKFLPNMPINTSKELALKNYELISRDI